MEKTIKLAITGAAGQIAYSFIPLLGNGFVFGENVKIDLRLLDIPFADQALKGVVMEIEDALYTNISKVWAGSDVREAF